MPRVQTLVIRRSCNPTRSHQRREFVGTEEPRHRRWQVGIRGAVTRQKAADSRQNVPEIPAIEIANKTSGRLGEFKNRQGAAGFQDALDFLSALLRSSRDCENRKPS